MNGSIFFKSSALLDSLAAPSCLRIYRAMHNIKQKQMVKIIGQMAELSSFLSLLVSIFSVILLLKIDSFFGKVSSVGTDGAPVRICGNPVLPEYSMGILEV